jgi:uncharacterized RDD family membrane protein YckC
MLLQRNVMFDSSLEALTPEGIVFVLSPAGLPVRTLAYAIDKVTQWLIFFVIFIATAFMRASMGIWLAMILNFCVDWFYHVFFELFYHGQSLGKRMTGIRVVRSNGAPVDPASSFLRNLLRFADTFFFLFPIALISITVSRGFRRLGDWAAGTLVVYSSIPSLSRNSLNIFLEKYGPIIPPRPLSNDEKLAILSFARRYPLLGEARANEIAAIYAPFLRDDDNGTSNAAYLLGIARKLLGENQ